MKPPKLLVLLLLVSGIHVNAQSPAVQSALINLGTNSCGDNTNVAFSSVGNPNTNPYLISNCGLSSIFSNVFNKFIAYNPKDNKIYINDISHGDSRVYIYDMGLPNNYSCPSVMPQTPAYEYPYIPNNWEFDVNGNVWCIRGLNGTKAIIERIDETTGTILFTKTVDFPSNNVPNTLSSGDIVILPNGRLFIAFGDGPTKFFEVTNYASGSDDATATFIQNMPKPCYGILYVNGTIELTGTDFGSDCYKFLYDIPTGTMSGEESFQLGMSPIDNASISPATGISKQLIGSTLVDNTTADIKYNLYAKNVGNVKLNNFNVVEDLGKVFGTNNVSDVTVVLDGVDNPNNLILNPAYNGVSDTKIFNDDQVLSNLSNGFVSFTISLRAKNLVQNQIYYNTAKSMGDIGEDGVKVSVIDSSNNGSSAAIDPNNDGDPGDIGENEPTPYFFGFVLPIHFIDVHATHSKTNENTISWTIGQTQNAVTKFEVEYSEDHVKWQIAGVVNGKINQVNYKLDHSIFSENAIYYRVRAYEITGKTYLSKEVSVRSNNKQNITILPNPADNSITINSSEKNFSANRMIYINDATGKKIFTHSFITNSLQINTSHFPNGYYIVNTIDKGNIMSSKIIIMHR